MSELTISPADRIRRVGEVLIAKGEEIYEIGGIGPAMWEEITSEEILGRIAVSRAVARAVVAQIRNMEDLVLKDIIIDNIINVDLRERTMKKQQIKAWAQAIQEELNLKIPGSVSRDVERETMNGPCQVTAKARVEFKLDVYDGAEEGCAIWYHGLERQMGKLKIVEEDYMAYAINATSGRARTTITMLDDRHKGDYQVIKERMIKMFDIRSKEDILSEFRLFKQGNNEAAREFFVKFQLKVNELLARGLWTDAHVEPKMLVQRFREKLRQDIDIKVGDHCEDIGIEVESLTLEDFFQIAQRIEKRCSRDKQRLGHVSAP